MKIAVLSDIHSNCFALQAVLDEVAVEKPDAVILLGDSFGYYPWALATYRLIQTLHPLAVLGNHDQLVLQREPPKLISFYWEIAKQNERELAAEAGAIGWLRGLAPMAEADFGNTHVAFCHGTPDDPLDGRYYPDGPAEPPWRPKPGDVLLMGHTHYPLVRPLAGGGLIANPGSVGQPRDGDVRPSWGLLFPEEPRFELRRTPYDVSGTIERLVQLGWHPLAIEALRKAYRGRLRQPNETQPDEKQ